MEFGTEIKKIRKEHNLTLEEVAKKSGLSDSYLSKLENGKRGVPKFENATKLAKALQLEIDETVELLKKGGYPTTIKAFSDYYGIDNEWINFKEHFNENDFKQYPFLSKQYDLIEILSDYRTMTLYKDWILNEEEKEEILNYVDYLHQKKKQNESKS